MFRLLIAILIVVLPCFPHAAIAQTEFRLPGADWKITLPKGWEVVPAEDLVEINAQARQAASDSSLEDVPVNFAAAFRPTVDDGSYMLVQLKPAPPAGARFDSLSSVFVKEQQDPKLQAVMREMGMDTQGQIYGDAPNARIIYRTQSLSSDADAVCCISHTNFGASSMVILLAYGLKQDFETKHDPVLTSILDSFAFDPGKVYAFGTKELNQRSGVGQTTYTLTKALAKLSVYIFIGILIAQGIRKWLAR